MISLLDDNLGDRVASVLLHSLWITTAIAGFVAVLLRTIPSRASDLRYGLSLSGLVLAIAAPVIVGFHFTATDTPSWVEHRDELPAAQPLLIDPIELSATEVAPAPQPLLRRSLLADLWSIGVVLLLLRLAWSLLQIELLARTGHRPLPSFHTELVGDLCRRLRTSRPVDAVLSSRVHVPTVVGWARPRILIPASALFGLTPSQLEAILAHEIAHIRRWDYLVNLLQSLLETLFFFHPAVWWLSHRVRIEREHCCDDAAVRLCGRDCTLRALATLEELRHAPLRPSKTVGPALAADGGRLLERMQRMALPDTAASRAPQGLLLLIVSFTLVGVAWSLSAAPSQSDPLDDLEAALEVDVPAQNPPLASDELVTPQNPKLADPKSADPKLTNSKLPDPKLPDPKLEEEPTSPANVEPLFDSEPGSNPRVRDVASNPSGDGVVPRTYKVVVATGDVIVLSCGTDDGVKVGDEFAVCRGDQFIANAVVAGTKKDHSSARVSFQNQPIEPGDRALEATSLTLLPDRAEALVSTVTLPEPVRSTGRNFVIIAVRDELGLVVLSGGSNDGVKVGDEFSVSRGSQWIGKIEVSRVTPDMSGARLLMVSDSIAAGDRVSPVAEASEKRSVGTPASTILNAPRESGRSALGASATVEAVDPKTRFVILEGSMTPFAVGQRFWIERGTTQTGYVEIIDTEGDSATARVRLVSPDSPIETGDRARLAGS